VEQLAMDATATEIMNHEVVVGENMSREMK
jgi:hypothetical protein